MQTYDYSQPYVTRDEYLEVKGVDLNIELQDDDNVSNKVNRFIQDLTNFVLDHLVMEYNCNELNRQSHNFEDLAEFRRVRFHYGMLDQIEYVLNNGLIQLDSGINRETGSITDFSGLVIGSSALKQFRLGGFCNKQQGSGRKGTLDPKDMPTIEELVLELSKKVDKVDGKGLSANDFSTHYKLLLETLSREIDEKVDKVVGKVLSSNDFTDAFKTKLEGIEHNAQVNKIEEIRINNIPATITGKAVNLTPTLHDETKEDVANKVTTISSESTNAQYPTAKCVYDNLQTVLEVALGSTKAFSVDPTAIGNTGFESGDATIAVLSFTDVNGNVVDVTTLKKGDLVFTLNGENVKYADRWLVDPATGTWGLIDADTPNLEGYVTTDTAQTITGEKTFSLIKFLSGNNNGQIDISNRLYFKWKGSSLLALAAAGVYFYQSLIPNSNNALDIGSSDYKVRDIHLSGKIKDGTNEFNADNVFNVINASDIGSDNVLTDAQIDIIKNGKPTRISGTFLGLINPILYTPSEATQTIRGFMIAQNGLRNFDFCSYSIAKPSKVISKPYTYISLYNDTGLPNIAGKALDYYRNNVYPYATNSTTTLQYETINNISVSADTTYTLATAPANTYPEYKANITNTDTANAITITLPSGTKILDVLNNTISSSNTISIGAGETIELVIQNGRAKFINWGA